VTNKETKKFELHDFKQDNEATGPDDDTETMVGRAFGRGGGNSHVPFNVPRGPREGHKRARTNENRTVPVEESKSLPYDG
jgi:hypothetical protein